MSGHQVELKLGRTKIFEEWALIVFVRGTVNPNFTETPIRLAKHIFYSSMRLRPLEKFIQDLDIQEIEENFFDEYERTLTNKKPPNMPILPGDEEFESVVSLINDVDGISLA